MHIAAAEHADAVAALFEIARDAGCATVQYGHNQTAAVDLAYARDDHGATPLHYAARSCAMNAIRRLLMFGASPDAQDNDSPTTRDVARDPDFVAALHHAAVPGSKHMEVKI